MNFKECNKWESSLLYLTRLYNMIDGEDFQCVVGRCFTITSDKYSTIRTSADLERVQLRKFLFPEMSEDQIAIRNFRWSLPTSILLFLFRNFTFTNLKINSSFLFIMLRIMQVRRQTSQSMSSLYLSPGKSSVFPNEKTHLISLFFLFSWLITFYLNRSYTRRKPFLLLR